MKDEKPYHIQAIEDLRAHYSPEHFQHSINECRRFLATVLHVNGGSAQEIARFCILRYLDLQLVRSVESLDNADLLAVVLRSQIELRRWADFVSTGAKPAKQFLDEAEIDLKEMTEKLQAAYPTLPKVAANEAKRQSLKSDGAYEDHAHKLCSKLIHASALVIVHPEVVKSRPFQEHIAVEILFYAWRIMSIFHDFNDA